LSCLRIFHRAGEQVGIGQFNPRLDLSGRRIVDLAVPGTGYGMRLAADEVPDVAQGTSPIGQLPDTSGRLAQTGLRTPIECVEKPVLNSDDLRIFLTVLRTGSAVAAARRLGIDHSTISRRLSALEQQLGVRLFDRSPRGLAPTDAADTLTIHAERIERDLLAAQTSVTGRAGLPTGVVRVATPEIFGTWLIAPRMVEFRDRYPALTVELAPESRSVSLSKREADVAIALRPPPRGRLVVRKLTDYTIGLYGSKTYLERQSTIRDTVALHEHSFVGYIDELLDYPEMNVLESVVPGILPVFRSSSATAQHAAVTAGVGLGMLHRIAAEQDPQLVRVLPDAVSATRSYWLVMHSDLQHNPRTRAIVDFVTDTVQRASIRF
jgi:DNA-binding transcriptional LysR family regulator